MLSSKHQLVAALVISITVTVLALFLSPFGLIYPAGAQLLSAIKSLGILNAPTIPLFVLIGYLFSLLPAGNTFIKITLLNNIFAVVSLVLLFTLTLHISREITKKNSTQLLIFLTGVFSLISFGVSFQFFTQITAATPFILMILLSLLILWLITRPFDNGKKYLKRSFLVAFILGIGVGVHPVILSLIPTVLISFLNNYRNFNILRFLSVLGIFILGVIFSFSYLPFRAYDNPFINFNDPADLPGFLTSIFGGNLINPFASGLSNLLLNIASIKEVFGWVLLLPIALGVVGVYQRSKYYFFLLFSLLLSNILVSSIYQSQNPQNLMLISYLALAIFASIGFLYFANLFQGGKNGVVIAHVLLLLALTPLLFNYAVITEQKKLQFTNAYLEDLYQGVKTPALILDSSQLTDTYLTYGYLEQKREAIPVSTIQLYVNKKYRDNLSDNGLKIPDDKTITFSGPSDYSRYINSFLEANSTNFNFYITSSVLESQLFGSASGSDLQISGRFEQIPQGLLLELVEKPEEKEAQKQLEYELKASSLTVSQEKLKNNNFYEVIESIKDQYALSFVNLAEYLIKQQNRLEFCKSWEDTTENNKPLCQDLALQYLNQGEDWNAYNTKLTTLKNQIESKESTKSAFKKDTDIFKNNASGITFEIPRKWWVNQEEEQLVVLEPSGVLRAEIKGLDYDSNVPQEVFIDRLGKTLGELVDQGSGYYQNFDSVVVKNWKDGQILKRQYFLFKGEKVVEVVVWPSDNRELMAEFEKVLNTLDL